MPMIQTSSSMRPKPKLDYIVYQIGIKRLVKEERGGGSTIFSLL